MCMDCLAPDVMTLRLQRKYCCEVWAGLEEGGGGGGVGVGGAGWGRDATTYRLRILFCEACACLRRDFHGQFSTLSSHGCSSARRNSSASLSVENSRCEGLAGWFSARAPRLRHLHKTSRAQLSWTRPEGRFWSWRQHFLRHILPYS